MKNANESSIYLKSRKGNKKEYIEREAAIMAIQGEICDMCEDIASRRIDRVPAADVVHVVRCKDCVNCEISDDMRWCTGRGCPSQLVPSDGFCDRGRRE